MLVPPTAVSAIVIPAAAASVRIGGVQVQEIHLNGALLRIHLIYQFQYCSSSFKFLRLVEWQIAHS